MNNSSTRREFECPGPRCTKKVVYDPGDSNNYSIGALLKKSGNAAPSVVYLTCENGHTHRYTVS